MTEEAYLEQLDLLDKEEIASVLDQLHVSATAEELYRSTKLPFAFNYVDKSLDVTHDNDTQTEHGSHVAGIAAANAYIPNGDGTYAKALDQVLVQGVAPDAQIITMKVFGQRGGAFDSDYMVAIEDAVLLGCEFVSGRRQSRYVPLFQWGVSADYGEPGTVGDCGGDVCR